MRVLSGFSLNEVGDEYVVVPMNQRAEMFHGMVRLNDTGAFLWGRMEQEATAESLTCDLLDAYEVDGKTAERAVADFLAKLASAQLIED